MATTIPDELTWPDSFPTRGHGLPPEMFDLLRRERPVAPVTFPSGHRAWLVTRRTDITAIGSSRNFSRDLTCPGGQRIAGDDFNSVPGGIFNLDPPEHTTVRRVVQPFFSPAAATALQPAIALAASDLATALRDGPNPADLHRAYAHPLAATLACDLMRVAPLQRRKIVPRLRSQVDYTTPAAKIDTSTRWMLDFAAEVIEAKTADYDDGREPRDPVEALIRAHHQGTITSEHLHATVMYLFVTSAEPVTGPVTTGVYTLLRHGDQLARVLRDPGLWPTAVAELLRLHHNGMTSMPRLALADTELHGVRIRVEATPSSPPGSPRPGTPSTTNNQSDSASTAAHGRTRPSPSAPAPTSASASTSPACTCRPRSQPSSRICRTWPWRPNTRTSPGNRTPTCSPDRRNCPSPGPEPSGPQRASNPGGDHRMGRGPYAERRMIMTLPR